MPAPAPAGGRAGRLSQFSHGGLEPHNGRCCRYEALASGDWMAARQAFETVLAVEDPPEALDGLGRTLWWLREPESAVVSRERAYSGFRRAGDLGRAARIALWRSSSKKSELASDAPTRSSRCAVSTFWPLPNAT